MTGKTDNRVEGILDHASFSLNTVTPDPAARLFETDGLSPPVAQARIEDIVDGVINLFGKVARRYQHARVRARPGVAGGLYDFDIIDSLGPADEAYSVNDLVEPRYRATPTNQTWLQRVTNNIGKYVYGAAVSAGESIGVYIDEGLDRAANEYLRLYREGRREEAKQYAPDFVEDIKTRGHESAHFDLGIDDEPEAESYGVGLLNQLKDKYIEVRDAIRDYGFRTVSQHFTAAKEGV